MDYINSIYEDWRYLMDNKSDPRTANWFLMVLDVITVSYCSNLFDVCVHCKGRGILLFFLKLIQDMSLSEQSLFRFPDRR